jgi:hypothetical protein
MSGNEGEPRECGGTHADGAAGELGADRDQARSRSAGAPGGVIARSLPEGAESGVSIAPQRGRGRPQGATNIKDTAVAQALIERFGHPLEADVAIGNADLGGLITLLRTIASDRGLKLGGSVMDIARWQADCRRSAMPYLMGKRAPITADGREVAPVVISLGRVAEPGAGAPGRSIEDELAARAAQDVTPTKSEG